MFWITIYLASAVAMAALYWYDWYLGHKVTVARFIQSTVVCLLPIVNMVVLLLSLVIFLSESDIWDKELTRKVKK